MILSQLVALFRAARLALHLGCGLALAVAYPWFSAAARRRILQRWSAVLLKILNIRIELAASDQPEHGGLIVSNHVSWLDVFVLNAIVPMRFVAKSEVRRWLAIGWLCTRAQTLFIERGKARSAARVNACMSELLRGGESLAVFPEGTTTDGSALAPFHASLLQPAIDANATVYPLALRYQDEHGAHSMAAAYIGDQSFGASLWRILHTPALHVHVAATPPLQARGMDRRCLAQAAQQHIGTALECLHATAPARTAVPDAMRCISSHSIVCCCIPR